MRAWLTILTVLWLPGLAAAGAWPREQGAVFLSLSWSIADEIAHLGTPQFDPGDYTSLYLEYGLTPRLTFGLDAGTGGGSTTAFAFLRYALAAPDAPLRTALSAGIGAYDDGRATQPLFVLGGAVGRGFKTRFGPGWANADASLQHRGESGETIVKLDITVGLKPRPGRMLILQLQSGDYPGSEPYARLAPSLVQQIRPGLFLETGAEIGLTEPYIAGLKLGTWLEF